MCSRSKYKELHDLRGHSLAFSSQKSVSSAMIVLGTLKKMGFNSSFFSNLQETGKDKFQLESVICKTVNNQINDSNTLLFNFRNYFFTRKTSYFTDFYN